MLYPRYAHGRSSQHPLLVDSALSILCWSKKIQMNATKQMLCDIIMISKSSGRVPVGHNHPAIVSQLLSDDVMSRSMLVSKMTATILR